MTQQRMVLISVEIKLFTRLKHDIIGRSMYRDIDLYVKSCTPCAQYNPRRQKPPGKLRPITPPEGVWQLVSMDFHGPITPRIATRQ